MRFKLIAPFLLAVGFVQADSKPFKGKVYQIPGKIEAEHYDEGEPGEAYHDNDVKNSGANYRGPTQVDIEKRPDASNGHGIGWTRKGEWLNYTVEVKESGIYSIEIPWPPINREEFFIWRSKVRILPVRSRFPTPGAGKSSSCFITRT